MKVCFVLFVLSLTASSSALTKKFPTARISGGETASRGQFPWHALITSYYINETGVFSGRCGGALISPKWILTAAHCFKKEIKTLRVEVSLGMICADDKNKTTIKAKNYVAYPDYDLERHVNDIGLIELSDTVKFSDRISSIHIISKSVPTGQKLIVSGFGQTNYNTTSVPSNYLLFVDVVKVEKDECIKRFCPILPETIVCCKGEGIKDVCVADSGGPLVVYKEDQAYLVGVVSAGTKKCGQGKPRIYSSVLVYRKWIKQISNI